MNILQVLSQFEVTGAETFAATLADTQIAEGHSVYIISDNFYTPTKAQVISHPIGKRDIAQRKKNIAFLKQFINSHQIDVVHAHSRAASWVCYFATRIGDVPLVSSIHGRQHLHFSSKLFSIYGEKRVAVCKSIYDHLNRDLKYPLDTLALVHNGIDLTKWELKPHRPPQREKKIVSFVGRLSGFKGDTLLIIVEQVFPKIYETYRNVEFHIIGGMNEKSKIIPAIHAINRKVGTDFIIAKGFSKDVEKIYRESDLIVGSGRVAMEALACGSPVVSIGESNFVGIISEETAKEALVTNFGDLDARRPIDVSESVRSILFALEHPDKISGAWGREFIEKNFEITAVTSQLNAVYTEAVAKKKRSTEVPVLSYYRIAFGDTDSPAIAKPTASFRNWKYCADLFGNNRAGIREGEEHLISAREFEAQLTFLKSNGFTSLNFFDLQEISAFKKQLPQKPVVLTFDPLADNFSNAAPLLQRYGFTAVFMVQTNQQSIDGLQCISFDQARKLQANGFEIGSFSHAKPKMNLVADAEKVNEIAGSKKILEEELSSAVITFTYPNGYVNEMIKGMVKDAGYVFALCMDEGRRNFWLDPLKVRRIKVFAGTSKFSFWKKTSGRYLWYKYVY
ncbi:MAG: glycosyltransferase [Bacteriovoracaceae bacterium]